jgi:hypothetical protein
VTWHSGPSAHTEGMDGIAEECWHDAGSEGWESTGGRVEDGAMADEGEKGTSAEGSNFGRRSKQEPIRAAFRIGRGTIRTRTVRPRVESA